MKNLNLGSGFTKIDGYLSLDKSKVFNPDIVHDLERFPYPFEDDSINNIVLSHVLEHLGQNPDVFNLIIKEIYRICKNGSLIKITVPHPRHDDFLGDPTHVRAITVHGLELYDRELNKKWQKEKAANTLLALIHNVNFKVKNVRYNLEEKYLKLLNENKINKEELGEIMEKYNNVIKDMFILLEVIKEI